MWAPREDEREQHGVREEEEEQQRAKLSVRRHVCRAAREALYAGG